MIDDWWSQAGCRGADPAVFTAERASQSNYREARALCDACPVRKECLNDILFVSPPVVFGDLDGAPMHQVIQFPMFQAGLTPRELGELYYQTHPIDENHYARR